MRKLKLQVQMSVDGFISGPNGEMDWLTFDWDDEPKACVTEITTPVDCIVLGRKLAQGFIPHWAAVAANPDHPELYSGQEVYRHKQSRFHQNAWPVGMGQYRIGKRRPCRRNLRTQETRRK